ncbi:FGGY-family carbohydrate kinase [Kribbella deserti]|uniref:L-fuculokinase n=1 Tax=Kribbella deserti TaxID=1926257 RepID=A0ABV6QSB8_9ACTN
MGWLGIDVGTTNTKVTLGDRTLTCPTPNDPALLVSRVLGLISEITEPPPREWTRAGGSTRGGGADASTRGGSAEASVRGEGGEGATCGGRGGAGARGAGEARPGVVIEGVGIAGMAETGAAFDADGRAVTPLISWRDQPGVEQVQELAEQVGAAEFFARTGLRLSAKLPIVTWRWLGARMNGARWMGAADLILYALTGTYATHLTHAQRLGVLDLRSKTWHAELLEFAKIRPDQLPVIADPMTVTGRVRPGVAGLREGTPVVLAGHDHLVAAWAAGVRQPGQVADSMGTSEAIVTPSAEPVVDERLRRQGISSGWYVDGRHGCAISGHGAAGGLVAERLASFSKGKEYDWLAWALQDDLPGELVAPYPAGRQAPEPDPRSRYDATRPVVDEEVEIRALIDGLAMHARWMAETQTALLGIDWRETVAFGGPTAIDGWMRRKALASAPRPFFVATTTAAAGAALIAAELAGAELRRPEPRAAEERRAEPPGAERSTHPRVRVPVDPAVAAHWDGGHWHRFHRLATEPPAPTELPPAEPPHRTTGTD